MRVAFARDGTPKPYGTAILISTLPSFSPGTFCTQTASCGRKMWLSSFGLYAINVSVTRVHIGIAYIQVQLLQLERALASFLSIVGQSLCHRISNTNFVMVVKSIVQERAIDEHLLEGSDAAVRKAKIEVLPFIVCVGEVDIFRLLLRQRVLVAFQELKLGHEARRVERDGKPRMVRVARQVVHFVSIDAAGYNRRQKRRRHSASGTRHRSRTEDARHHLLCDGLRRKSAKRAVPQYVNEFRRAYHQDDEEFGSLREIVQAEDGLCLLPQLRELVFVKSFDDGFDRMGEWAVTGVVQQRRKAHYTTVLGANGGQGRPLIAALRISLQRSQHTFCCFHDPA